MERKLATQSSYVFTHIFFIFFIDNVVIRNVCSVGKHTHTHIFKPSITHRNHTYYHTRHTSSENGRRSAMEKRRNQNPVNSFDEPCGLHLAIFIYIIPWQFSNLVCHCVHGILIHLHIASRLCYLIIVVLLLPSAGACNIGTFAEAHNYTVNCYRGHCETENTNAMNSPEWNTNQNRSRCPAMDKSKENIV